MLNIKLKKIILAGLYSYILIAPAHAANWLMLQGTEPESSAPRAHLWGFIQAQYQKDNSASNGGQYVPPKLIGPNLSSQEQFNVNRARIGVRGTGLPLDGKVNYFFLAEFGNNGITAPGDRNVRITDASITLNQIKGARLRMGLFKTPGAEEGLQAIHVFDYINFTTVTNQLLLERLPNQGVSTNNGTTALPVSSGLGAFDKSVAAFRDVGIQVFDSFNMGDWEHSYAIMYGNGNGLNFGDNDDNKDIHLYWSSELIYGGKGGRREGMKLFAWSQTGKRFLDVGTGPVEHDRDRSGLGFKFLKKPWRLSAEYMKGEGMIFQGPDKASFDLNGPGSANGDGADGKASGYYVEGGWYIPGTKWEIDLRHDIYNRSEGDAFGEVEFTTTTYGTQYHINKKTRINMEFADREAVAVNFAPTAGPNGNLSGVGGRFAVQLTHIF